MKTINLLIVLVMMLMPFSSIADDVDIYLESDGPRANPPYLMLMVDYRPSTFSNLCGSLSACVPKFTEESFGKLCSLYAIPAGGNATYTENACRLLFLQIKSGGLTTQSTTGF